ncbi:MAG: carboxypeptidase regulatory-like domain-containing protein [bacterium]
MKRISILAVYILVLLTLVMLGACTSDKEGPAAPNPVGPGNTGDPMDPSIPTPFGYPELIGTVADIGIEGDGDIVLATDAGLHLFTPYGVWKKSMSPELWQGLATTNFNPFDTGRGIMAISSEANDCRQVAQYDDSPTTGGLGQFAVFDPLWWGGEPDPYTLPGNCYSDASSSTFASCDCTPHPISYHPAYPVYVYQKVLLTDCIADSDCEWPYTNVVPISDPAAGAICAYHVQAPNLPTPFQPWFTGGEGSDFMIWLDWSTYSAAQNMAAMLGVLPACGLHNLGFIWDITNPPPMGNFMSDRGGCSLDNICDFEFDSLNRLIIVVPGAHSVAITDPVVFAQTIVVQKILGGRQGAGTLPGEFHNPSAIALDPRNQNIVISDTGNGRIQILDHNGSFIREFGGADSTFVPAAVRVDSFGAIYAANISASRLPGDNLRIFTEFGAGYQFGTIEGYVKERDSPQLPIGNALVHLASQWAPLDTTTDKDGYFIFPAVAIGTHDLVGEKNGYESGNVTAKVEFKKKTVVDIFLKKNNVGPAGFGIVRGEVFTTFLAEPIPGVTAEIVGLAISTKTTLNGEFTLYSVPVGEHTFRLSNDGVIYYEKYVSVSNGATVDLGAIYLPIPINTGPGG